MKMRVFITAAAGLLYLSACSGSSSSSTLTQGPKGNGGGVYGVTRLLTRDNGAILFANNVYKIQIRQPDGSLVDPEAIEDGLSLTWDSIFCEEGLAVSSNRFSAECLTSNVKSAAFVRFTTSDATTLTLTKIGLFLANPITNYFQYANNTLTNKYTLAPGGYVQLRVSAQSPTGSELYINGKWASNSAVVMVNSNGLGYSPLMEPPLTGTALVSMTSPSSSYPMESPQVFEITVP